MSILRPTTLNIVVTDYASASFGSFNELSATASFTVTITGSDASSSLTFTNVSFNAYTSMSYSGSAVSTSSFADVIAYFNDVIGTNITNTLTTQFQNYISSSSAEGYLYSYNLDVRIY